MPRMAFEVALAATSDINSVQPLQYSSLFASHHGDLHKTLGLLQPLSQDEALSPTQFALSVHNAISGQYSLLQCPVYLIFCLHEANGYNLIFNPFADKLCIKRQQRTAQLFAVVQHFTQQLKQVACRYPLQGFNFYDFWQLPAASQHEEYPGDNSSTPAGQN